MPGLDKSGMVLEDCTCEELPPWHHHRLAVPPCAEGELEAKDGVNAQGRWHCMVVNGKIRRAELIEPSSAWDDAVASEEAEIAAKQARKVAVRSKMAELRAKKHGGQQLSQQDVMDFVNTLVGD